MGMFKKQDVNILIDTLGQEFKRNSNPTIAAGQKAYMRNQFEFFGLKSPVRRELQKPFLIKKHLPPKQELHGLVKHLWTLPEREYQLFVQELCFKYVKRFERHDIELLAFMVTCKSWWDTVDYIAVKLIGPYFKKFPEQLDPMLEEWLSSNISGCNDVVYCTN